MGLKRSEVQILSPRPIPSTPTTDPTPGIGQVRGGRDCSVQGMDTVRTSSLCGFVILAAGQGTRFGSAKQVAPFRGDPLVIRATTTALAVVQGNAPVRVVIGAHRAQVEAVLSPLVRRHTNLELCYNAAWASGLASSLQVGLQSLEAAKPKVGAVLYMLGDQPLVPTQLLLALQERWHEGWEMVAPACDGRLLGVPALFARTWWPALGRLAGDRGARPLLEQHSSQVGLVEVDTGCLIDIDMPEDLASHSHHPTV